MSNLLKSKFLVGVMIVAAMFVVVGFSKPTTAAADCSITTTLRVGSTGAQVVCLQTALGGLTADGSFGPKTKAAVISWQLKSGLVADGVFGPLSNAVWMANAGNTANFPAGCSSAVGFSSSTGLACYGGVSLPAGCSTASGFSATTGLSCSVTNFPAGCTSSVGFSATTGLSCSVTNFPAGCTSSVGFSPTTGASCATGTVVSYPAGCTSSVGFSPTTGASCSTGAVVSANGEGSLTVTAESSPSNGTEIAYNTTKSVMALKLKATGANMTVNRVDFNFNKRAWLYAEKAGLYDGATLVAEKTLSSTSFDEIVAGSNYRLRFDGLNIAVAKDATKILTLKLTTPSIISDVGGLVTVTFATDSVRASDGTGLVSYEGVSATRTFKVTAATAGALAATLDTTSPKAGTAIVSATDTTLDTVLLVSGLKATGDTVHITAIPYVVTVVNAGTGAGVTDVVDALHLYKDGVLIGSGTYETACSSAKNCIVTFTGLDEYITRDATVKYTIKGDLKPISLVVLAGSTVQVTMTIGGTLVAEDSDFTTVVPSGSSIGLAQHIFVKAPIVTLTSAPTPTVTTAGNASTQTGTFVINFSVKAQGSDIYVDMDLAKATSAAATVSKMSYDFTAGTGGTGTVAPILTTSATVAPINAGMYKVVDGTTETFTLTGVIVGAGAPAFYSLNLTGVGFAITDVADGTIVMNWGLVDFKTPSVFLSN